MAEEVLQPDRTLFYDPKRGYELRYQLSEITDNLKLYDKISVIFLLCDSPQAGISVIEAILNDPDINSKNNLFFQWLKNQISYSGENWKNVMAEFLTIIQNYKLTKSLGFTKKESNEKFMPKNNLKSYNVSCVRKVLYNLCEQLNSDECKKLIGVIENKNSIDLLGSRYLEYKLLTWSEKEIISLGNDKVIDLEVLVKALKSCGLSNFVHDIEVCVQKSNCQMLRLKSSVKSEKELSEYYEIIDLKKLGLCVIINEKNFTSSLFPKRWGSDKDVERLIEVFTAFGFDIKLYVDLTYEQFIETLGFYAKTVEKTSSFFVLIILSHGSENVVFTSDSHPVDMNMIEMIFQAEVCPNLIGKPKIFIVQSCQGEKWQKVIEDSKPEIETDNFVSSETKQPIISLGPQKGDSMIAWSTVQGFASFRDRYNGSWYIQELCNELWKFGDAFDLVEILTKVNKNLRSKVYGGQFMVPSLLLSLRAKIQFPNLSENFSKGRKLMLERLIFEKCFRDFIIAKSKSNELSILLQERC